MLNEVLHPGIARVDYWKVSDPLTAVSFVATACFGTEKGGKWQFCCRSFRNVESWGTFVRTGCQKTVGIIRVQVSALWFLPANLPVWWKANSNPEPSLWSKVMR